MQTTSDPSDPQLHSRQGWSHLTRWMIALILVILAGWALHAMASVLVPVVFAIFIALVMAPLDRRIVRALPDRLSWVGRVVVGIVLILLLALFLGGLAFAGQQFLAKVPDLTQQLDEVFPGQGFGMGLVDDTASDVAGSGAADGSDAATGDTDAPGEEASGNAVFGQFGDVIRNLGGTFSGWAVEQGTALAQGAATMVGGFVAAVILVFFLVLLALSERPLWKSKTDSMSDRTGQEAWRALLATANLRLRRFLVTRTLVGAISAALYAGWLAIFGVDLLLVWAVLTFLLTFIPNLGSIISGILPTLYAFLVLDPWTAFMVGAGLFVIEQVVGNYLDPKLLGRQIALSPTVILVALLVWGWIWGVAGALLATPMMIAALIVFNHIRELRPIALMISNQPDQAHLDDALKAE
jgi:AI-2 transport protein TqsA